MIGKMQFIAGLGVGYVLGTRSGRERYQQMKDKAQDMWQDPRVQDRADYAQEVLKEKASDVSSAVAAKVSDVGSAVATKVSDKVGSHSSEEPTELHPIGVTSSTGPQGPLP